MNEKCQAMRVDELVTLGEHMQISTARSLVLLRAIERTVISVSTVADELRVFHKTTDALLKGLASVDRLIPEDQIIPALLAIEDSLENAHAEMKAKLASAKGDSRLNDEDGVCATYENAINAVCDLHDCVDELRWAVMHHNAALDKSGGKLLTSAAEIDAFFAAL